jgi:hypothetical protein
MRTLYRLLSLLTLFSALFKGGPTRAGKHLARRQAHKTLARWMR